jgi:putative SOS response-associated peptidase YedK
MCGRFASTLSAEFIRQLFETEDEAPNLPASWNIAPSQDALVVRRHPNTGLVPAECFYEWRKVVGGKQPYAIARQDGAPLALGAIWEGWRSEEGEVIRSFAIITTAANAEMRVLHDRMPVILERLDWPLWLGETEAHADAAILLRPAADSTLALWPVSGRVNSPRNNDADLLRPIAEGDPTPSPAAGPNPA